MLDCGLVLLDSVSFHRTYCTYIRVRCLRPGQWLELHLRGSEVWGNIYTRYITGGVRTPLSVVADSVMFLLLKAFLILHIKIKSHLYSNCL